MTKYVTSSENIAYGQTENFVRPSDIIINIEASCGQQHRCMMLKIIVMIGNNKKICKLTWKDAGNLVVYGFHMVGVAQVVEH